MFLRAGPERPARLFLVNRKAEAKAARPLRWREPSGGRRDTTL